MNGCMRGHAAILLRGCVLGVTVIATAIKSDLSYTEDLTNDVFLMTGYSYVLLCTPVYTIVAGLLHLSFTSQAVYDNIAVISICMPALTLYIVYVYNLRCKPVMINVMASPYNSTRTYGSKFHEYINVQWSNINGNKRKKINQDDTSTLNGELYNRA